MPHLSTSDSVSLAYAALVLVRDGLSERAAVRSAAISNSDPPDTRRRALSLVLGTIRERDTVDRTIQSVLPDEHLPSNVLQLFRLGTYAATRPANIIPRTELRRALRKLAPSKYLAALELLFGSVETIDPDGLLKSGDDIRRVALETHHPEWWVEYCVRVFSRGEAIQLLSTEPRPRYIHVNPLRNRGRTSLPKKATRLAKFLSLVSPTPKVYAVQGSLSRFSAFFTEGLFQSQDLASFLAVNAAEAQPGETVLDLCAAPGAKTAALAQFMKNRGRIVSVDFSRSRMETWKVEMSRLGVKIAEPIVCEAGNLGSCGRFDLVVIDPPCSGTGVFDRNPGMKWHVTPDSLGKYAKLQQRFLNAVLPLLKDDGRILYCTCSVTVEENEAVIRAFLKEGPDLETRPVLGWCGSPGLQGMTDCRRFYPHRDRSAGYFIALMKFRR